MKTTRDIEDGLLNYEEKKFIDFIEENFMNVRYINKFDLTETQTLLNSIDESVKNHVKARLDKIITSYEDDSQILMFTSLSITVLLFMIEHLFDLGRIEFIIEIILFIIIVALTYQVYFS